MVGEPRTENISSPTSMTLLAQQESTVKHLGTAARSIKRAYSFSDLSNYSLKERLVIRAAGLVFYFVVGVIGTTVRFTVEGVDYLQAVRSGGHLPIFNIWHNRSFLAAYWLRQRRIAD